MCRPSCTGSRSHRWILRACLALATLFVAACTHHSQIVPGLERRAAAETAREPAEATATAGDFHGAAAILEQASAMLLPRDEVYYDAYLYHDRARFLGRSAWFKLRAGDTEGALAYSHEVFDGLAEDEATHDAQWEERIGDAEVSDTIVNLALGAGVLFLGQDLPPSQLRQAVEPILRPALSTPSIDLPSRIDEQPGTLSDGVRVVMLQSGHPLNTIGHLIHDSGSRCTASLVGYRLALTNGHCVLESKRHGSGCYEIVGRLPLSEMRLVFLDLDAPDLVGVEEVTTPWTGCLTDGTDWALLVLDRHPAGRWYLGVAHDFKTNSARPASIFVAGYSSDLNDGRFVSVDWGLLSPAIAQDVASLACLPGAARRVRHANSYD